MYHSCFTGCCTGVDCTALALQLFFKESVPWGCVTGLEVSFGSSSLPFCPSQTLTSHTLSTALYKIDLERTSRGHLLAFSMADLYLVSAWGEVSGKRQYLLCDQLVHLESQSNSGRLELLQEKKKKKVAFKAKTTVNTVKIVTQNLSP